MIIRAPNQWQTNFIYVCVFHLSDILINDSNGCSTKYYYLITINFTVVVNLTPFKSVQLLLFIIIYTIPLNNHQQWKSTPKHTRNSPAQSPNASEDKCPTFAAPPITKSLPFAPTPNANLPSFAVTPNASTAVYRSTAAAFKWCQFNS